MVLGVGQRTLLSPQSTVLITLISFRLLPLSFNLTPLSFDLSPFAFMPSNLKIKIGDITTAVEWQSGQIEFDTPRSYQPFIAECPGDIRLSLHLGAPELELGGKVFDSQPIWCLHRKGAEFIIDIFGHHPDLRRLLVFPQHLNRADLFFAAPGGKFIDPLFGPTMELLMINYLARGQGVIIHACGIEYNGNGLLFTGESGAGKSTLANMWSREKGATVLSDDRTIVRYIDGEFRMYGTPWHGEAKFGSPRGVKLENIFFLRHGRKNAIETLSGSESVLKLLQCSFPPYWDAAGMEYTLRFFEKLSKRVPCHELEFEPDKRVIEFVKR
jgi:hypothetical protein